MAAQSVDTRQLVGVRRTDRKADGVRSLCGPRGCDDPAREALSHGTEAGSVLGGAAGAGPAAPVRIADRAPDLPGAVL